MRVGVDLDGVCFDFAASLRRYLVERHGFGADTLPEPTQWEFWRDWNMTRYHWLDYANEAADTGYLFDGPVLDDAATHLRRLRKAGHSVHVITSRDFGVNKDTSHWLTFRWLAQRRIVVDSVTFTSPGCKAEVPVDVMVEDSEEGWRALVDAGVHTYLVRRPWNTVLAGAIHPGLTVANVGEFVDRVLARSTSGSTSQAARND